jgi:hypothetical protein
MSERVVVEHDFECSEKAFWDTFLNTEYNREMFLEHMNFARWDLVEIAKTDDFVDRVVEVEPYVGQLPAAVRRAVGERIAYREEGRLDRKKNTYKLRVIPGIFPGKVHVTGKQYTRPVSEHRCTRIFEADVEVKVFGIGHLIEKQIASDMRKSYESGASFTQNYMRQHGIS